MLTDAAVEERVPKCRYMPRFWETDRVEGRFCFPAFRRQV